MQLLPAERSTARRRLGAAALVVATVAGGWAISADHAAAATTTVNAKDFAFTPAAVTVKVGDTVRWVNDDAEPHDLEGSSFGSGELPAGASYSHTFTAPEQISYFCKIHTYMTGTIDVVAASSAPAPAPAPAAPGPAPCHHRDDRTRRRSDHHGADHDHAAAEHVPGRARRAVGPEAARRRRPFARRRRAVGSGFHERAAAVVDRDHHATAGQHDTGGPGRSFGSP